jgi:hypothetical protein
MNAGASPRVQGQRVFNTWMFLQHKYEMFQSGFVLDGVIWSVDLLYGHLKGQGGELAN